MKKREIRKRAYNGIVKEGRTHQEIFDELRSKAEDVEMLASEVSKVPSTVKMKETATLRYIFMGVLGLIIILRALGIVVVATQLEFNGAFILFAIVIGVLVPGLGVYAAISGKTELFMTVGTLLTFGVLRSMTRGELDASPETFIGLVPTAAAIGLAFWIPSKMKTAYSKKVVMEDVNGVDKKQLRYIFNHNLAGSDEVLDTDVI